MRDPKRIDIVLDELRDYWHSHPDYRLGQIVVNIVGRSGYRERSDIFLMEDDVFLEWLTHEV